MLNKKITKILIGTNNTGKIKEIRDLLPKSLKIYSTEDLKVKSPVENGNSFLENSFIKAQYYSNKSKMICLSDDSGLEIDILDGAPGIYSARWGGKNNDFNKSVILLNHSTNLFVQFIIDLKLTSIWKYELILC